MLLLLMSLLFKFSYISSILVSFAINPLIMLEILDYLTKILHDSRCQPDVCALLLSSSSAWSESFSLPPLALILLTRSVRLID